jgi:DNA-binding HxlR family transcriptional regulator
MRSTYNCPVELALDLFGGKWRVVILARIKDGPLRYGDLRRLVPRMSDKMLTQTLRELVERGLVEGRGGAYGLTPRGESARGVLASLYRWGGDVAPQLGVVLEPVPSPGRQN